MKELNKYLTEKPKYLADFEEPEFIALYDKHKAKFYLVDITKAMLAELNLPYGDKDQEFNTFKSWVYMAGSTQRKKVEIIEQKTSNKLKGALKTKIGEKVSLKVKGYNILGYDVQKESIFKVIKDADGRIFLMPPKARKRGYLLDTVTILEVHP